MISLRTNGRFIQRARKRTIRRTNRALTHLSTGIRSRSASPTHAAMATGQRASIITLRTGSKNAQQAVGMLQTASQGIQTITQLLDRAYDLALMASDSSIDMNQRQLAQEELDTLLLGSNGGQSELSQILDAVEFNGIQLLSDTISSAAVENSTMGAVGGNREAENIGGGTLLEVAANDQLVPIGNTQNQQNSAAFDSVSVKGTVLEVSQLDHGQIVYSKTSVQKIWNQEDSGTINKLSAIDFIDNERGWAVGNSGTILHTSDYGDRWSLQDVGLNVNLNDVAFIDQNNGYAVGDKGLILKTTDGGTTYSKSTAFKLDAGSSNISMATTGTVVLNNGLTIDMSTTTDYFTVKNSDYTGATSISQHRGLSEQMLVTGNNFALDFTNADGSQIDLRSGDVLKTANASGLNAWTLDASADTLSREIGASDDLPALSNLELRRGFSSGVTATISDSGTGNDVTVKLQGAGSLTNDKITVAAGTYSVTNIDETLIADQNQFEVRFTNKNDSDSLTMLRSGDAIFGAGETISTTDNTSTIDLVDSDDINLSSPALTRTVSGMNVQIQDTGDGDDVRLTIDDACSVTGDSITIKGGTYTLYNINEQMVVKKNEFVLSFTNANSSVTDLMTGDQVGDAGGEVQGTSSLSGGSGYSNGTTVATTGGSGSGLIVTIDSIKDGLAATSSLTAGGSGYSTGTAVATTGGSGSGLTVDVAANGSNVVTGVTINNGGQDYVAGETITVSDGNNDATFSVDTVTDGIITAISVANSGYNYANSETIRIGGGGGNATFQVNGVSPAASWNSNSDGWTVDDSNETIAKDIGPTDTDTALSDLSDLLLMRSNQGTATVTDSGVGNDVTITLSGSGAMASDSIILTNGENFSAGNSDGNSFTIDKAALRGLNGDVNIQTLSRTGLTAAIQSQTIEAYDNSATRRLRDGHVAKVGVGGQEISNLTVSEQTITGFSNTRGVVSHTSTSGSQINVTGANVPTLKQTDVTTADIVVTTGADEEITFTITNANLRGVNQYGSDDEDGSDTNDFTPGGENGNAIITQLNRDLNPLVTQTVKVRDAVRNSRLKEGHKAYIDFGQEDDGTLISKTGIADENGVVTATQTFDKDSLDSQLLVACGCEPPAPAAPDPCLRQTDVTIGNVTLTAGADGSGTFTLSNREDLRGINGTINLTDLTRSGLTGNIKSQTVEFQEQYNRLSDGDTATFTVDGQTLSKVADGNRKVTHTFSDLGQTPVNVTSAGDLPTLTMVDYTGTNSTLSVDHLNFKSTHFADVNNGWAISDEGEILKTSNGGTSWSKVETALQGDRTDYTVPSALTVTKNEFDLAFTNTGGAGTVLVTGDQIGPAGGAVQGTGSLSGGSGYSNGTTVATTGGSGSGLTIDVVADGSNVVTGVTISNGGQNYEAGDSITVSGGNNDATFSVDTVTDGIITAISVANSGYNYTNSETITISGGAGNATFQVNGVSPTASWNSNSNGWTVDDFNDTIAKDIGATDSDTALSNLSDLLLTRSNQGYATIADSGSGNDVTVTAYGANSLSNDILSLTGGTFYKTGLSEQLTVSKNEFVLGFTNADGNTTDLLANDDLNVSSQTRTVTAAHDQLEVDIVASDTITLSDITLTRSNPGSVTIADDPICDDQVLVTIGSGVSAVAGDSLVLSGGQTITALDSDGRQFAVGNTNLRGVNGAQTITTLTRTGIDAVIKTQTVEMSESTAGSRLKSGHEATVSLDEQSFTDTADSSGLLSTVFTSQPQVMVATSGKEPTLIATKVTTGNVSITAGNSDSSSFTVTSSDLRGVNGDMAIGTLIRTGITGQISKQEVELQNTSVLSDGDLVDATVGGQTLADKTADNASKIAHTFTSGTKVNVTGTNQATQIDKNIDRLNKVYAVDSNTAWAVGQNSTIVKTTDGGSTWSYQKFAAASAELHDVAFSDANTGWAVGANGTILSTTDGGANWSAQTSGITSDLRGVAFKDANNGWAVGAGAVILTTDDGGSSWIVDREDPKDPADQNPNYPMSSHGVTNDLYDVEIYDSDDDGLFAAGDIGTLLRHAFVSDVYLSDRTGSNPVNVTSASGLTDEAPDWTPVGNRIVFVRSPSGGDDEGQKEIYTVNNNGTGVTRLTDNTVNEDNPDWSPDGTKIAFQRYDTANTEYDLYVMNDDGTNASKIADGATDPIYDPNGKHLLFVSSNQLKIMNADGSGSATTLVSGSEPAWSANGSKIAYVSNDNIHVADYTYDADNDTHALSNATKLTDDGSTFAYSNLAWSSDGTELFFDSVTGASTDFSAESDTYSIKSDIAAAGSVQAGNSLSGGTGYSAGTAVTTTGGSGSGLTVDIDSVSNGVITAITIRNGGYDYANGETVTISGGNGDATFQINGVNSVSKTQLTNTDYYIETNASSVFKDTSPNILTIEVQNGTSDQFRVGDLLQMNVANRDVDDASKIITEYTDLVSVVAVSPRDGHEHITVIAAGKDKTQISAREFLQSDFDGSKNDTFQLRRAAATLIVDSIGARVTSSAYNLLNGSSGTVREQLNVGARLSSRSLPNPDNPRTGVVQIAFSSTNPLGAAQSIESAIENQLGGEYREGRSLHINVQAIAPLYQVTKQVGVTSGDALSGNAIVINSEQILTPELVSQARNAKLDGNGNFGTDLSQHSQFADLSQVRFRLETTRTAGTEYTPELYVFSSPVSTNTPQTDRFLFDQSIRASGKSGNDKFTLVVDGETIEADLDVAAFQSQTSVANANSFIDSERRARISTGSQENISDLRLAQIGYNIDDTIGDTEGTVSKADNSPNTPGTTNSTVNTEAYVVDDGITGGYFHPELLANMMQSGINSAKQYAGDVDVAYNNEAKNFTLTSSIRGYQSYLEVLKSNQTEIDLKHGNATNLVGGMPNQHQYGALGLNSGAESKGTGSDFTFQLGKDNTFSIMLDLLGAGSFGADLVDLAGMDISTVNGASNAVSTVEAAVNSAARTQTKIGSAIANMRRQIDVIEAHAQAVDGFRSRLEDVNFIEETQNLAKLQILIETSTSALAHAQLVPQTLLELLSNAL